MNAEQIITTLRHQADPQRAKIFQGFFKTGKGQYGEGDVFWGISVPQIRVVAKRFRDVPLDEILRLLKHPVHEIRLCGVLLMVEKYPEHPAAVFRLYLKHTKFINNWDLVDLSADKIVGRHIGGKNLRLLLWLAESKNIWERRIAMVATFHGIKNGRPQEAFAVAEQLLGDEHDLIHKASGWMLREAGKRCSSEELEKFLRQHASRMPRTMLRYALEHFAPERRRYYMNLKRSVSIRSVRSPQCCQPGI